MCLVARATHVKNYTTTGKAPLKLGLRNINMLSSK